MNVIFAVIFHYTVVSLLSYNKILIYLSSYPSIYLSIYLSICLSLLLLLPGDGYYLSIYLPISPPLTKWGKRERGRKLAGMFSRMATTYLPICLSLLLLPGEGRGRGAGSGRNVPPHGYYLSIYLPISLTKWRKRKRGRKLAGMFPRMATAASASRPLPSCGDNRLSQDLTFILYVTFKKHE